MNVLRTGEYVIMGEELNSEELPRVLRLFALGLPRDEKGRPQGSVLIRADKHCKHRHVQDLLTACMAERLCRTAFATRDAPPPR